jgi:hypothetical protein
LIALAYVIQIQSAALYIKIVPKIFGPPTGETPKDLLAEVVAR